MIDPAAVLIMLLFQTAGLLTTNPSGPSHLPNVLRFRSNVFLQDKELVPDPASLGPILRILVRFFEPGLVPLWSGGGFRSSASWGHEVMRWTTLKELHRLYCDDNLRIFVLYGWIQPGLQESPVPAIRRRPKFFDWRSREPSSFCHWRTRFLVWLWRSGVPTTGLGDDTQAGNKRAKTRKCSQTGRTGSHCQRKSIWEVIGPKAAVHLTSVLHWADKPLSPAGDLILQVPRRILHPAAGENVLDQ